MSDQQDPEHEPDHDHGHACGDGEMVYAGYTYELPDGRSHQHWEMVCEHGVVIDSCTQEGFCTVLKTKIGDAMEKELRMIDSVFLVSPKRLQQVKEVLEEPVVCDDEACHGKNCTTEPQEPQELPPHPEIPPLEIPPKKLEEIFPESPPHKTLALYLLRFKSVVESHIVQCEIDNHVQQAVYSTFHSALTQICYGCGVVRTSITAEEIDPREGITRLCIGCKKPLLGSDPLGSYHPDCEEEEDEGKKPHE